MERGPQQLHEAPSLEVVGDDRHALGVPPDHFLEAARREQHVLERVARVLLRRRARAGARAPPVKMLRDVPVALAFATAGPRRAASARR